MKQDNRTLNFHLYRFHLLPLSSDESQVNLFPEEKLTKAELKKNKNRFFREVLDNLESKSSDKYPIALHDNEDEYYVFKIANKKSTELIKDFKAKIYPTEPYTYVIINSNKDVQKIAISDSKDAFSSPSVVKKIFKEIFQRRLKKYHLNIEIKTMFDPRDFWEIIKNHQHEITHLDFLFVKPNLARIHSTLKQSIKDLTDDVNSHETHLSVKAPTNGILENINKKNDTIKGLADYSSKGGGNIKLKVKGIRKKYNTNDNPIIEQIDEISIEGSSEQIIKVYKSIVD